MQPSDPAQPSFYDLTAPQHTSSNRVLEIISAQVSFTEAEAAVAATYSPLGRPGHRVSVMLRIMLLQHLYGLSDPQAEEQLRDRLSFQKFTGLVAGEAIPDETSICRFRVRLIKCGLHETFLAQLNQQLEAKGYKIKRTTLVDATIVESSRQRPDVEDIAAGRAPDADARYARKHGKSYYGYKAHVSTDGEGVFIRSAKATAANVDDSKVFAELIPPNTCAVYADKAYESHANKNWLREHGIANGILKKGANHIKLTAEDKRRNTRKSRRRAAVERIFAHLKKWQHYVRVRYLGLVKNQLELTLKAVTYNLKKLAGLHPA